MLENNRLSLSSHTPGPHPFSRSPRGRAWFPLLALLFVTLLISACSTKDSGDSLGALMLDTQNIALAYQAHGDLAQAQTELTDLGLANPEQWLLLTAETAIAGDDATLTPGGALALTKLARDLGLRSTAVDEFARQNNLLPGLDQVQAQVETAAVAAAPVEQDAAITPTNVSAPSPTPDAPTPTPAPTAVPAVTAVPVSGDPKAAPQGSMNVRGGPGTEYAVVDNVQGGVTLPILAKSPGGDWWQVQLNSGALGWIYAPLVDTSGDTGAVAVAATIPTPPPTVIPAPTAIPQPTATPVPSGPDFRLVSREMWDVVRNGGRLDGPSPICGEKRELHVIVLDAGGNRFNGVAVQAIYEPYEIFVTGSQGKGDGEVEFVLGSGQGVFVLRDADGREASSDRVEGMVTNPKEISDDLLIGGRFCTDAASCASFRDQYGCYGHYSWTVIFQRAY